MSARRADGVVAVVVAAAVVVHALADSDGVIANLTYLSVLLGASVGAGIGAARSPRGHRLVPILIAAGVSLTALGDVLWGLVDQAGGNTDISIADLPWLASYAALCAGLWVLLRRSHRHGRGEADFVIDAVTIVVVTALIFWSLSINTIIDDDSLSPWVRTVWSAYPVADAVLLALVLRVMLSRDARAAIDVPFAAGVCLWLAADIAYLQAPASTVLLAMMDAAWMIAPVLVARAAWKIHGLTSADAADAAGTAGPRSTSRWVGQILIAIGPLLVPPGLELVNDLRGGSERPLQLFTGTAVLSTLAVVRTARLIRSEERARAELEEARDAALAASRTKSMFLANMSHEIRTPLTTVLAAGELLEETGLDDLQLRLVAKMQRSGELLKQLVEGILDFSRVEAGQIALTSAEFDLHALVADVADVYAPRASVDGLRFEWHLDPSVQRIMIGDAGRLFQVLTNLLDNALKFTHDGTVRLTVDAQSRDRGDVDLVGFVVEDTGIGIRAADQGAVFESFVQVDGTATRRYGGSGLGLAICEKLVGLMDGTITVQSRLGVGSTFTVRVPLTRAVAHHRAEPPRGVRLEVPEMPALDVGRPGDPRAEPVTSA